MTDKHEHGEHVEDSAPGGVEEVAQEQAAPAAEEKPKAKRRRSLRSYYAAQDMAPAWGTLVGTFHKWQAHWKLFVGTSLLGAGAMGLVAVIGGATLAGVTVSSGVFQNAASAAAVLSELAQRPALAVSLVSGAVVVGAIMLILSTWMTLAQVFAWRWVSGEEHHEMGIRNAYRASWPLVPSYIWISIISTLLVVAGIVAFVVPGVILALCFSVLPAVAVVEGRKGMDAVRRTIALVRPHLLGTLWRIIVTAVVLYLPARIVFNIVGGILGNDIGNSLDNLYGFIVGPIFSGVLFATFLELKDRVHGTKEEGTPLLKILSILGLVAVGLALVLAIAGIL